MSTKSLFCMACALVWLGCVDNEKLNVAKIKSDEVMQHLVDTGSEEFFKEKYFPRGQMAPILSAIRNNCDYENREGKYVDHFYQSANGSDFAYFIYEYYMKCDSIRFLLKYDLSKDPELVWFKIEGVEVDNPLIIDKSKTIKGK